MRKLMLFLSITFGFIGYTQETEKRPKCEDVEGIKVTNFHDVPDDYTGVAFICKFGNVHMLETYTNGKVNGLIQWWWMNGQLMAEAKDYKDGKRQGLRRMWYKNGQLWLEENYKDGEMDGLSRYWFKNGQLEGEVNYKEGKITDDKLIYYNKRGNICKTEYYENGKMVKCEGDCN